MGSDGEITELKFIKGCVVIILSEIHEVIKFHVFLFDYIFLNKCFCSESEMSLVGLMYLLIRNALLIV